MISSDFTAFIKFMSKYVLLALFAVLLSIPPAAYYVYKLRQVGELLYGGDIAEFNRQGKKILWLSGYYSAEHHIKTSIAKRLSPKVVALGSSRVTQITGKVFNKLKENEFYNMGMVVYTFSEADDAVEELIKVKKPELIIFGLDWFFFEQQSDGTSIRERIKNSLPDALYFFIADYNTYVIYKKEFLLSQLYILQNAWKDPFFYDALVSLNSVEAVSGRTFVGLGARRIGGFRNDGSMRYHQWIDNPVQYDKEQQFQIIEKAGKHRGNYIIKRELNKFRRFLSLCVKNNIPLIIILPPIDDYFYYKFINDKHRQKFWKEFPVTVKQIAHEYGIALLDYTNTPISENSGEFLDFDHISEVLYAKILLDMAKNDETKKLLSPYIDISKLESDIEHHPSLHDLHGD
ncbi:MAG: hypothetical protein H7844_15130 [Nitrospirae bacterium YQR-1]